MPHCLSRTSSPIQSTESGGTCRQLKFCLSAHPCATSALGRDLPLEASLAAPAKGQEADLRRSGADRQQSAITGYSLNSRVGHD